VRSEIACGSKLGVELTKKVLGKVSNPWNLIGRRKIQEKIDKNPSREDFHPMIKGQ